MVELVSPLTPAECEERLSKAVDPVWLPIGPKPLRGRVQNGRFECSSRFSQRRSLSSTLSGTISGAPTGSRITLRFGSDSASGKVLSLALFGPALAISLYLLAKGAGWGAALPLVFAAMAFVALGTSHAISQREEEQLTDLICKTLDARVVAATLSEAGAN